MWKNVWFIFANHIFVTIKSSPTMNKVIPWEKINKNPQNMVRCCTGGFFRLIEMHKKGLKDRRKFLLDWIRTVAAGGKLNFLIALHFCYANLALQLPSLATFTAAVLCCLCVIFRFVGPFFSWTVSFDREWFCQAILWTKIGKYPNIAMYRIAYRLWCIKNLTLWMYQIFSYHNLPGFFKS